MTFVSRSRGKGNFLEYFRGLKFTYTQPRGLSFRAQVVSRKWNVNSVQFESFLVGFLTSTWINERKNLPYQILEWHCCVRTRLYNVTLPWPQKSSHWKCVKMSKIGLDAWLGKVSLMFLNACMEKGNRILEKGSRERENHVSIFAFREKTTSEKSKIEFGILFARTQGIGKIVYSLLWLI